MRDDIQEPSSKTRALHECTRCVVHLAVGSRSVFEPPSQLLIYTSSMGLLDNGYCLSLFIFRKVPYILPSSFLGQRPYGPAQLVYGDGRVVSTVWKNQSPEGTQTCAAWLC
jgi:hypothetical protein